MAKLNDCSRLVATLSCLCVASWSCEPADDATPVDAGTDEPKTVTALVVTADAQTGAYATVTLPDLAVMPNIQITHTDAMCRFDPLTRRAFIVTDLGSDAVHVIDPSSWLVVNTYSVGPGTRPQDMAVVDDERAYVARLNDPSLLLVRPTAGQEIGAVDLSAYADSDGVPEAAGIFHLNGKVYVLLRRLLGQMTTDYSSLLVLDGATGSVESEARLSVVNPLGPLRYNEVISAFIIPEVGKMSDNDGGIEYYHPSTGAVSGIAVSEQALGGDVIQAVISSLTKGYAIVGTGGTATKVVSFDPSTGQKTAELLVSNKWDYLSLELTPDRTHLWVSDRSAAAPGIRIFDTETDQQITAAPLHVGLPPVQVCFVVI